MRGGFSAGQTVFIAVDRPSAEPADARTLRALAEPSLQDQIVDELEAAREERALSQAADRLRAVSAAEDRPVYDKPALDCVALPTMRRSDGGRNQRSAAAEGWRRDRWMHKPAPSCQPPNYPTYFTARSGATHPARLNAGSSSAA
jgi:hypothetical protein